MVQTFKDNALNSDLTTNRASVVLVYVDATKGWLYTVENNVGDLQGPDLCCSFRWHYYNIR